MGHIVLRYYEKGNNASLFKHSKVFEKDNPQLERDVEKFASKLLMLTSYLLKLVKQGKGKDIKRLYAFYQVSKQAMEIKLKK